MTARTYAFCVGSAPMPAELSIIRAIEQFGVKAVTGRDTLTAKEIAGYRIAGLVAKLYQQREAAEDWAKWTERNPKEAAVLEAAHRIYEHTNRI